MLMDEAPIGASGITSAIQAVITLASLAEDGVTKEYVHRAHLVGGIGKVHNAHVLVAVECSSEAIGVAACADQSSVQQLERESTRLRQLCREANLTKAAKTQVAIATAAADTADAFVAKVASLRLTARRGAWEEQHIALQTTANGSGKDEPAWDAKLAANATLPSLAKIAKATLMLNVEPEQLVKQTQVYQRAAKAYIDALNAEGDHVLVKEVTIASDALVVFARRSKCCACLLAIFASNMSLDETRDATDLELKEFRGTDSNPPVCNEKDSWEGNSRHRIRCPKTGPVVKETHFCFP